ncbi:hypothetical protein XELAEV_18022081mg [Xenopus laevis]|uniref:Mucin-5AC n=1 Tax=Xenopus laevis TaxID=8355 RepID=A0A974HMV6_XENLA|nr:hypothetical protein XELAEV_18022081mg [Xenopus laevis]
MGTFRGIPLWILPIFLGLLNDINTAHNNKVCSTWGNFNFKNFDGDVFHFPGTCNYVFSSHCKSDYEDFNIQIQRTLINSMPVISKIIMRINGVVVQVIEKIVLVDRKVVQLPYSGSGVQIEKRGVYYQVSSKTDLVLMWNDDDNSVLLELDKKYSNQTCGLCGDYNGISIHNEFINNGVFITEAQFGNLQRLDGPTEQCPDVLPLPKSNCTDFENNCENTLMGSSFANCHLLVDVDPYIEACVQDLCRCDSSVAFLCMCNTFAEYSRQCAHAGGQPSNWRTKDFCPQKCPFNMEYQECVSPCTDTCTIPERALFCDEHCLEGCYCPKGTVFDDINNSGCISVDMCPCTIRGEAYASEASYSTPCLACVCSSGKWNCKDLPCPSTCSLEGGSHMTTYDQTHYRIHGDCNYILTKICSGGEFTVVAELRKCGLSESETCLKSIMILLDGGETNVLIKPGGGVYVNSVYTQLPVSTARVTIFRPTSFYIIVHMLKGIQVVIQLIPLMQVYVVLDPIFKTKTCGLCGNFNDKQSDDFQAINGVIEGTGASFANTWKTQADCPNIKNVYEDPCSLSVENEQYALQWCGLITDPNGPFAACHSQVNPQMFQKNCMFDTCNCEKSEDCMCASLSSYSRTCVTKGVKLTGWQANTPCSKYTKYCPESLNYTFSMSTCQPTCRSRFEPDITCSIKFTPVDGCSCTKGFYMDDSGKCVPEAACPCYYKGSIIPSGEVVQDKGMQCFCAQGELSCLGASEPECIAPMVYLDCKNATENTEGAECQKSCQTLDMECYRTKCVSGCVCPDGLLSDGEGGCIKEELCPCVHNEATYQPGENITFKCNTCTCKNRIWHCTDKPCLGTCVVYGDGHYITFDGKQYTFNGDCEYILAQDHGSDMETKASFRVITENIPCGTTGTTCSKAVKVFLEGFEIILTDEQFEVVKREPGAKLPYMLYTGIYIVIMSDHGLILLWDKKTSIFIKLSREFEGKVYGQCGNYDGNGNNDFTTRSFSVVGDPVEFGNSWKLNPKCPDVKPTRDPCSTNPYRKSWAQRKCSIINSKTFSDCHFQVDPSQYYDTCVTDACACDSGGDCECMCTAIAAYALACSEAGICVSWRTPHICPLFCDYYNSEGEYEWHYKPCGHSCLKTCRNPTGKCLYDLPGLEGCYPNCPAEKPFLNEDTMDCVAQCGCYDDEGNYFSQGSLVPTKENCQTCVCSTSSLTECKYDKTVSTVCVQKHCEWSQWFDESYPKAGPQNGDFETFQRITDNGHSICNNPEAIECRAKIFPDTPINELQQNIHCNASYGLICYNKDQLPPICYNYEIRVRCCVRQCPPPTTTTPFTETSTKSTTQATNLTTSTTETTTQTITETPTKTPTTTTLTLPTAFTTPTTEITTTPETTIPTTMEPTTEPTTTVLFTTTTDKDTTPTTSTTETTTTTATITPTVTTVTQPKTSFTTPTTEITTTTETTGITTMTKTTSQATTEPTTTILFTTATEAENISTTSTAKTPSITPTIKETTNTTTEPTTSFTIPTTEITTTPKTTEITTTTKTSIPTTMEPTNTVLFTTITEAETTPTTTPGTTTFETAIPFTTPTTEITTPTTTITTETTTDTTVTTNITETTIPTITEPTATTTRETATTTIETTMLTTTETVTTNITPGTTTFESTIPFTTPRTETLTTTITTESTDTTETTATTKETTISATTEPTTEFSTTTSRALTTIETTVPTTSTKYITITTTETPVATPTTTEITTQSITSTTEPITTVPFTNATGSTHQVTTETPSSTLTTEEATTTAAITTTVTTNPLTTSTVITTTTDSTIPITTESRATTPFKTTTKVTKTPSATEITTSTKTATPIDTTETWTLFTTTQKITKAPTTTEATTITTTAEITFLTATESTTPTPTAMTKPTTTNPTTTTDAPATPTTESTTRATESTNATTTETTPTTTVSNSTVSMPPAGCQPDKKPNESWKTGNCTTATCHGNNVISYDLVKCPEVKELTCTNGFLPIKVYSQDGCCFYYECQCVCSGWGDPHYVTFDGIYYTFLENCTYVLVQQITPKYDNFRVLIDNYFCSTEDGLSCPQSIIIYYKNNEVLLTHLMFERNMKTMIRFNDNWVTTLGFTTDGITVTSAGINMVVEIPEIGAYISLSGMNFVVKLPYSKFGYNTEGQCGTCSNNQSDECRLPSGKILQDCSQMADHWKVNVPEKPYCNLPPPPVPPTVPPSVPPTCLPSPLCDVILSKVFAECHIIILPKPYHDGCIYDACRVGNESVECASLEVYASLCSSIGVCVDWRANTDGHCPYMCPAGMVYNACGPLHPKTCEQRDLNNDNDYVTEGCYCPKGTLLSDSFSGICVCDSCEGRYSADTNSMVHECSCCQEMKTSQRQVELICKNKTKSVFSFIYVEECGCTRTECQDNTQQ